MSTIGVKKTLNLHKYSLKVNDIFSNRKLVLPIIFAIAGLFFGCFTGKGEGRLFLKITEYFTTVILKQSVTDLVPYFFYYLIIPSIFIGLIFFFGMSACGGFAVCIFPFSFSYIVGIISYYMYLNYTLKGLAYCVIEVFPYAVLSEVAIILCTAESLNMSEFILKSISRSTKLFDYGFQKYYKLYLKNYTIVFIAVIIKIILDYLFGTLFSF